ncbi:hypothetical protein PCASD_15317 [Puccinia coronata f. sp. avenae]|uniref:Uncharacterized protein n=1 Tax=Puccinia coronata f. sp. avenae TaxID=200324 RepID=A0A2N5UB81_9BASI|nr:hypothetical protein PCASD_15317 [Puccinia coronata f. sp. avenae]
MRKPAEECIYTCTYTYTAGRFRKFGIHPLGVPATQGSHDQFWRPRDRTEPTTPLRQGRGVAAGPIGSPKRSLRPGNSTILFMTNFVRHDRLTDIAVNAKGAVTGVALVTVVCIASIGTLPICWVTGPREGRHFDEPFVPPCTRLLWNCS